MTVYKSVSSKRSSSKATVVKRKPSAVLKAGELNVIAKRCASAPKANSALKSYIASGKTRLKAG